MTEESLVRPEAVVFDIGNVLIGWAPASQFDSWVGAARREAFFAATGIEAVNTELDRGGVMHARMTALAEEHPEFAAETLMWRDRWHELLTPVIDHSVRLLRALRARGVPVFALSNFGDATFTRAEEMFPFLTEFDRRWISGRMGTIKPEAEIYARLETESGVAPDRLLFTDDSAANIAAARARGWQAHLFEHPEGWAERLVAAGLLSEDEAR